MKALFYSGILVSISFCLSAFSILSTNSNNFNFDQIQRLALLNQLELQNGDLIFRKGRSIESRIVLLSDGDSEYSHVGLVYKHNRKTFVIHASPIEEGDKDDFIRMESIEDFVSEEKAVKFALYRVAGSLINFPEIACSYAFDCFLKKYRFDNRYDLKSNSKLYCTELIWKAYKYAGIDLVRNRLKNINLILIHKKIIMPSSIIESKLLKKIYSN